MKYKFICSFNGRLIGAIGITYKINNVIVFAENEKQALLECYKTYEHIIIFEYERVNK